jgi:CheY-like chemotaxis protein
MFDLIVLDLGMPISDGFETCQNILKLYDDKRNIFKMVHG